jgi:hypothetical protein
MHVFPETAVMTHDDARPIPERCNKFLSGLLPAGVFQPVSICPVELQLREEVHRIG